MGTDDLDLLYADLIEAASDPARAPRSPKTVRAGTAAAAGGRDFLRAAYGSEEAFERAMRHRADADEQDQS